MRKVLKKWTALLCAAVCGVGCMAGLTACNKDTMDREVTVYMPDGAPALAMVGLMAQDTEDNGISYFVTKADGIASKVTYKDEVQNADFCVMPLNAAAKLLGDGNRYTMLGTVTNGNLYIVSKSETVYTRENLSSLVGKRVGVLQINNVPGLTFKTLLTLVGVDWAEVTNDGTMYEDKVNLLPILDATSVGVMDADCFVIAEPAATAQSKKGYNIVGDLQAMYDGGNGYPQAVLMAKREMVEEHSVWTGDFVEDVKASMEWLKTATGEQIVSAINGHLDNTLQESSLKAPLLTADVIGRCGVRYVATVECEPMVSAILNNFIALNPNSTTLPASRFFWMDGFNG